MRSVSIVGIGQVPVVKSSGSNLRQLAASVVKMAMEDAGVEEVDALFASNMLADELQGQKHVAALIADEAGLKGIGARVHVLSIQQHPGLQSQAVACTQATRFHSLLDKRFP